MIRALLCLALLSAVVIATATATTAVSTSAPVAPLVANKKVKAALITDDVVVVEFDPAFEAAHGQTVEYQAFFSTVEPMDSVLSVNQSSCCMDEHHMCQTWVGHQKLTCHGLKVDVAYRANVMVRVQDAHGVQHAVYKPIQIAGADIHDDMPAQVTLDHQQYDRVVQHATNDIVQGEINTLKKGHAHGSGVSSVQMQNDATIAAAMGESSSSSSSSSHHSCIVYGLCAIVLLGFIILLLIIGWRLFEFMHGRVWGCNGSDHSQSGLDLMDGDEDEATYQPLVLNA